MSLQIPTWYVEVPGRGHVGGGGGRRLPIGIRGEAGGAATAFTAPGGGGGGGGGAGQSVMWCFLVSRNLIASLCMGVSFYVQQVCICICMGECVCFMYSKYIYDFVCESVCLYIQKVCICM